MCQLSHFVSSFANVYSIDDHVPSYRGASGFSSDRVGTLDELFYLIDLVEQEKLLSYVAAIESTGIFELSHPSDAALQTRARFSIKSGATNFIFFSDEQGGNWWAIAQLVSFINAYVIPGKIVRLKSFAPAIQKNFDELVKAGIGIQEGLVEYGSPAFSGFLLSFRGGPFHFFYDHLYQIWRLRNVSESPSDFAFVYDHVYFDPGFISLNYRPASNVKSSRGFFLYPCLVERNLVYSSNMGTRADAMSVERSTHSLRKFEEDIYRYAVSKKHDWSNEKETCIEICVWMGISSSKRSWVSQIHGSVEILCELEKHFSAVRVIFDGMTAPFGGVVGVEGDMGIFSQIKSRLADRCSTVIVNNVIGADYEKKIRACSDVDFFITDAGTASFVPLRVCKKPGVLHSNKNLFTFPDSYSRDVVRTQREFVQEESGENGRRVPPHKVSYDVSWQHVFNQVASLIGRLRNINIPEIDVPDLPVDNPSLRGAANVSAVVSHGSFEHLATGGSVRKAPADILREVAIGFERDGDIVTALRIMKKAQQLRPHGPLISRKVEQYLKLLS